MTYLQKYAFRVKQKDINVKVFNMITNKNEAKTMVKHVPCGNKNSTVQLANQIKNGITIKKIIVGNLTHA